MLLNKDPAQTTFSSSKYFITLNHLTPTFPPSFTMKTPRCPKLWDQPALGTIPWNHLIQNPFFVVLGPPELSRTTILYNKKTYKVGPLPVRSRGP